MFCFEEARRLKMIVNLELWVGLEILSYGLCGLRGPGCIWRILMQLAVSLGWGEEFGGMFQSLIT